MDSDLRVLKIRPDPDTPPFSSSQVCLVVHECAHGCGQSWGDGGWNGSSSIGMAWQVVASSLQAQPFRWEKTMPESMWQGRFGLKSVVQV